MNELAISWVPQSAAVHSPSLIRVSEEKSPVAVESVYVVETVPTMETTKVGSTVTGKTRAGSFSQVGSTATVSVYPEAAAPSVYLTFQVVAGSPVCGLTFESYAYASGMRATTAP